MFLSRKANVFILVFLLSVSVAISAFLPRETAITRGAGERKVLLELFTATWCVGCPHADRASDELFMDMGPEKVSIIQYHTSPADRLSLSQCDNRADDYGVEGIPSAWFDGGMNIQGASSFDSAYSEYEDAILHRLSVESPLTLSVTAEEQEGNLTVSAHLALVGEVSSETLSLNFVLYENGMKVSGDNRTYNFVARALYSELLNKSDLPSDAAWKVSIDAGWNLEKMGVVAFVQNGTAGEVYQSENTFFGDSPSGSIGSLDGGKLSGTAKIEGTANGSSPPKSVYLRIDEGSWIRANGSSEWKYEIDTTSLRDGEHMLYMRVFDEKLAYSDVYSSAFSVENRNRIPTLDILFLLALLGLLASVYSWQRPRFGKDSY